MATGNEEQRVQKVIADILRRREAGEQLQDEDVVAANPDLADQLKERLKQLQVVANARKLAALTEIEETIAHAENHSAVSNGGNRKLVPGQQIRHYVLEEQIGLGGFGSVWRARDTKLDCEVAIKVPARESLTRNDIDRFIREARVSAQLRQHPNIVSVHEADWDDQIAFIVCDLIDGESLGDRIDKSRVPPDEAVNLVVPICGALQHAHQAGVIHRDLKPDNILLDANGNPHVTDFGLARQEDQSLLSESGQTLGTAHYMSPEQASGNSDRADRRSDVFSAGVMLYELFTGERPFRGSVPRILQQICEEDPPSPRSLDPRIPVDLETICLKCIEKDPNLRYQSAAELADELLRFQRHEPILAHPVSAAGRLWRWSKRNPSIPWLSLALIVVTLTSTLIGGYLVGRVVNSLKDRVEEYSQQTLDLPAAFAVADAKEKFLDRFKQVERLSRDELLRESLAEWNDLEGQRVAVRSHLPKESSHSTLQTLQRLMEKTAGISDDGSGGVEDNSNTETFSWFVCDDEGYQIARYPRRETMGEPFHWRSYFTGELADRPRESTPQDPAWLEQISQPRLSPSFLTLKEDAWVLAISIPIQEESGFQGVVGIFIELSELVSIPGISETDERFMSIYDARQGGQQSRPIRHRFYTKLAEEKTPLPAVAPKATDLSPLLKGAHEFTDPFFEGSWRAVAKPIDPKLVPGLYVVVQEEQNVAAGLGEELGDNLVVLGLSVLGLAAAVLFPAWAIILKRVVK